MTPLVCLLSGFLQQKFGPRLVLMLTCLPYLLGWALAALTWHYHSVWLLYISRLCVGAGHGLVSTKRDRVLGRKINLLEQVIFLKINIKYDYS